MKARKVYVLCPATRHPSGGVKQLFRLVDNLNLLGMNAVLIRQSRLKAVKWFQYDTPIDYFPYVYFLIRQLIVNKMRRDGLVFKILNFFWLNKKTIPSDAIIVLPELYAFNIHEVFPEHKIVIFNQNCFLTFESAINNDKERNDPYLSKQVIACLVVSEHSKKYMNFVYPTISLYRIRLGISEVFSLNLKKKRQIAYMPRKLKEDGLQIFQILNRRKNINGWSLVPIDNMSESQVATVLKESAIFLSFNYQEGLGLPPLEAMACGCYVVGYTGQAGEEYFLHEFSTVVRDRDIINFVEKIEEVAMIYDEDPSKILSKGELASTFVRNRYNYFNELEDTKTIWNSILLKL